MEGDSEKLNRLDKEFAVMGEQFKEAVKDLGEISVNLKSITKTLNQQADHSRRIERLERRMEKMDLFYVVSKYPKISIASGIGLYVLAASGMWKDVFRFLGGL